MRRIYFLVPDIPTAKKIGDELLLAAADLILSLHRRATLAASAAQLGLMLAGIGTIALIHLEH